MTLISLCEEVGEVTGWARVDLAYRSWSWEVARLDLALAAASTCKGQDSDQTMPNRSAAAAGICKIPGWERTC